MEKELKCPECGSIHIKKIEDENDFLSYKPPDLPEKDVRKAKIKNKQAYLCLKENCGHKWEEDI